MTKTEVLLLAVTLFACGPKNEGLDTSRIPSDLRSDYDVFAQRCSKCHSLSRPLQANITDDQQWIDYVNRMRRQPGSGISYDDQTHILRFLKWYAADLRAKNGSPPPAASAASLPTNAVAEEKDAGDQ